VPADEDGANRSRIDLPKPPSEVQAILDQMAKGPDGKSPALYLAAALHPALLDAMRSMGDSLRATTLLSEAERETVVHRTAARVGSAYEWGIHAELFATRQLGLGADWLRATWSGAPEDIPDPGQSLLATMCDEMHETGTVSDETWARLADRYDDAQIVELIFLVGYYHLVSYLSRALQLPLEPWAADPDQLT
jgi:alkylhydroperoxidase family enzyme